MTGNNHGESLMACADRGGFTPFEEREQRCIHGVVMRRNDAAGGPVDEIWLRLNVAVEPVVGNHPAGDDDARPEEERDDGRRTAAAA